MQYLAWEIASGRSRLNSSDIKMKTLVEELRNMADIDLDLGMDAELVRFCMESAKRGAMGFGLVGLAAGGPQSFAIGVARASPLDLSVARRISGTCLFLFR